jgi:hypothetical protein
MSPRNHPPLCPDCGEPMVAVEPRPQQGKRTPAFGETIDLSHPERLGATREEFLEACRYFLSVHGPEQPRITRRERRKRREKRSVKR